MMKVILKWATQICSRENPSKSISVIAMYLNMISAIFNAMLRARVDLGSLYLTIGGGCLGAICHLDKSHLNKDFPYLEHPLH